MSQFETRRPENSRNPIVWTETRTAYAHGINVMTLLNIIVDPPDTEKAGGDGKGIPLLEEGA